MYKVRYIIINNVPRNTDNISIPEKGIEGKSISDVYHSIWTKDGELLPESTELLDQERSVLSDFPEFFRHKYYEYKNHFKSIDSLLYNVYSNPSLNPLSLSDRQERCDLLVSKYLSDNKLSQEDLFDNSAFRFEYWITCNQYFSKWYQSKSEAFHKLIDLINALNNGRNPVLEL